MTGAGAARFLIAAGLSLAASAAHSQPPSAPESPQSRQECENYKADYQSFLHEGHARLQSCISGSRSDVIGGWVKATACSNIPVQLPPECEAIHDEVWCAGDAFLPSYRACLAKVPSGDSDGLQRRLMLDTANGVPKSATSQGLKMAKFLAENGKASESNALLSSMAKVGLWKKDVDGLLKQFDSSTTPGERLAWGIGKMNKLPYQNGLSYELLGVALNGLTTVSKDALAALSAELGQFSGEIAQDHQDAADRMHEARLKSMIPAPPPSVQTYRPPTQTYVPSTPQVSSWEDQFCARGVAQVQACVFEQQGCSGASISACWNVCGLGNYVKGGPECQ